MVSLALKLILQKRLEKNFSQEYIAIRLDLSQSQYGRIETGKTSLRLDILIKILEILDIDFEEFFSQLGKTPKEEILPKPRKRSPKLLL